MGISPYDFLQSRAVRGYNPQFLNTEAQSASSQAGLQASPDLNSRMLQILSGNLGGTLTGAEKLSALGALLKSVSRGSQTSPQQVIQGIQQQKLQQVQGALQMQELQKQAGQQARRNALREELLANAGSDAERAQIRILSDEALDKFALQRLEQKAPEMENKQKQLQTYYEIRKTDPARASVYWRLINPTQVVGSIESGLKEYNIPEPPMEATAGAPSAGAAPTGGITELTPPQPKPVVPTESENQAAYLYTRLQNSLSNLKTISAKDPSAAIPTGAEIITQGILGEDVANQFKSPERQQYISSRRDALGAALTLATGAAYTPLELDAQERSYFPQYGDDPETIKFKEKQWNILLQAARTKAGRAAPPATSGQGSTSTQPRTFTIDGRTVTIRPRG